MLAGRCVFVFKLSGNLAVHMHTQKHCGFAAKCRHFTKNACSLLLRLIVSHWIYFLLQTFRNSGDTREKMSTHGGHTILSTSSMQTEAKQYHLFET